MSLRYLLDTSIVSVPISKKPIPSIIQRLSSLGHQCAIAAPVWHELSYGCRRLPRGKRRAALESYVEDVVGAAFPILPYDQAAAKWHANERARLQDAGQAASFVDGQIAAIAHVNDLALVTLNLRDFARFDDLRFADWGS